VTKLNLNVLHVRAEGTRAVVISQSGYGSLQIIRATSQEDEE
jgi:hypothetical protein